MQYNKKCKTNKMCKTVSWDLINSNMNRDVQGGCANGLYRVCTHNTCQFLLKVGDVLVTQFQLGCEGIA